MRRGRPSLGATTQLLRGALSEKVGQMPKISWRQVSALALAAFFVVGSLSNIFAPGSIYEEYLRWGYPHWFHFVTGSLELTTAVLLAQARTRLQPSSPVWRRSVADVGDWRPAELGRRRHSPSHHHHHLALLAGVAHHRRRVVGKHARHWWQVAGVSVQHPERVRPKMMTVVAITAGLMPIMWSTGTEIMQRTAVPMIGGMISSTLLTLIVIPAIFGLVKGFRLPSGDRFDVGPTAPSLNGPIVRPSKVLEPVE
jgi:hypothetical protein